MTHETAKDNTERPAGGFEGQVKETVEEIRPALQAHGGDVELIGADESTGVVSVKLTGACAGCPMAAMTLKQGVEKHLKSRIPQVKEVQAM